MLIVLAPHLIYPTRNGGDIYIDRISSHISRYRDEVLVLGVTQVITYKNGKLYEKTEFTNQLRPKNLAALRTLLFQSHYLLEKSLTTPYIEKAHEIIKQNRGAKVIYSFITTSSLNLTDRESLVITQNDEIDIYKKQKNNARNLLQRLVASKSEDWLVNYLGKGTEKHIYAHITTSDKQAYDQYIPKHRSVIIPAGVDPQRIVKKSVWDGNIYLLFSGNLSVKMNLDALLHFRNVYWKLLYSRFFGKIKILVAGSNPSNDVCKLCNSERWKLFPNVSDEELLKLYKLATFGILPYPYTAGAKIKLLNNLAAGLPVLATANIMNTFLNQNFYPNLYSDDSSEWVNHISNFLETGVNTEMRRLCQQFTEQYSWGTIIEKANLDLLQIGF